MNKVASLHDYVILNNESPIGYTYDLYTCIALLIHRNNNSLLAHIEANEQDNDIDFRYLLDVLNLGKSNILKIELFPGPDTNKHNLELICLILDNNGIIYEVKQPFIDMYGKGSIGYNYNTKDYYLVDENYELKEAKTLKKTL